MIIIVGNGASILNQPLGKKIDAFETVVRFNVFSTAWPAYTGTKISVWVTNDTWEKEGEFVDWKQQPQVLVKCTTQCEKGKRIQALAEQHGCKWFEFPKGLKQRWKDEIQKQRKTRTRPSVGLYTVSYYLEWLKEPLVYIHGFDHLQPGKPVHYFDDKKYPITADIHYGVFEKKIFQHWEQQGRIRRLKHYA